MNWAILKPVSPASIPWHLRITLLLLGAGLVAGLGIACCLTPNPHGLGTHEQLGLRPCTIRVIYHMRCPTCGMTTSWAHLVRGQVVAAVEANAGGALLGSLAIVVAPWALLSGARGKWTLYEPGYFTPPMLTALLILVTLGQWWLRA